MHNKNIKATNMNINESVLLNLKSKDIGALKLILNNANELDLIGIIKDLSTENQAIIYRLLSKEKALFLFEQLNTADQEKLMLWFSRCLWRRY